jgi:hypothetical protein
MTTALGGGEGSASRPGRSLPPGKTRYPIYSRLGGPQGRSGHVRKISPPPGFYPRTVQPVKCTLVQALRLCTGRTARSGSRGIAVTFYDHGIRRVSVTPRPLFSPPGKPGIHCTGGWVGTRAGLDRCGKSRPHRDSIPGPSSP